MKRIQGMMYGLTLGDALGVPYEFSGGVPLSKYSGLLVFPTIRYPRGDIGASIGIVGQVSDDTEMTLALASALIEAQKYDKELVLLNYIKWANSGCPFLGTNTKALLVGTRSLEEYMVRFSLAHKDRKVKDWSQSNGCLMRCAPLAVLNNPSLMAKYDCELTNPSPICVDACQLYVRYLHRVLNENLPTDQEVIDMAKTEDVRQCVTDALMESVSDRDVTNNKGWILHSLWCAIRALEKVKKSKWGFQETIDWVINLGGDTDTNACISGALIGAYLGYDKLSQEERTAKNIQILRAVDTTKGQIPRPTIYTIGVLNEIIKGLENLEQTQKNFNQEMSKPNF